MASGGATVVVCMVSGLKNDQEADITFILDAAVLKVLTPIKVSGAQCFVAGTPVWTGEGSRAIEGIEVGDLVWSRSDPTEDVTLRHVTEVFARRATSIVWVTLASELGELDTLGVTEEHPFWTTTGWVGAADLAPGALVLSVDAEWLRIDTVAASSEETTVFNFSVEEDHTYHVGAHGAWVHNMCAIQRQITERGLRHSFRHAPQWFGGRVTESTHLTRRQRLVARAAGSSKVVPWRTGDTATIGHLARIDEAGEGAKYFFVQVFTEGPYAGELATALFRTQGSSVLSCVS